MLTRSSKRSCVSRSSRSSARSRAPAWSGDVTRFDRTRGFAASRDPPRLPTVLPLLLRRFAAIQPERDKVFVKRLLLADFQVSAAFLLVVVGRFLERMGIGIGPDPL